MTCFSPLTKWESEVIALEVHLYIIGICSKTMTMSPHAHLLDSGTDY